MTDLLPQFPLPVHLSHSSVKSLVECGERYRLERVYRIRSAPSFAATAGKVFHVLTEILDRRVHGQGLTRDAMDVLDSEREDVPVKAIAAVTETVSHLDEVDLALNSIPRLDPENIFDATPAELSGAVPEWVVQISRDLLDATVERTERLTEFPVSDWKVYGRASKQWPGKEDKAWWDHHLPIFLVRYLVWMRDSGFTLAMLNGTEPAIEVSVGTEIDGVRVEGYIDRIWLDSAGNPIVGDIKTNSNEPRSAEQLGLYSVMLETLGFPRPRLGYYWMARKGTIGQARDLTPYTFEFFAYKFRNALKTRNEGVFVPNTDSKFCPCPLVDWCYIKGGKNAALVPRPWDSSKPSVKEKANG